MKNAILKTFKLEGREPTPVQELVVDEIQCISEEIEELKLDIKENGSILTTYDKNGEEVRKPNPSEALLDGKRKHMRALLNELKLTPKSKTSNDKEIKPEEEEAKSPLAQFMASRKPS